MSDCNANIDIKVPGCWKIIASTLGRMYFITLLRNIKICNNRKFG